MRLKKPLKATRLLLAVATLAILVSCIPKATLNGRMPWVVGIVRDGETDEPIAGAAVMVEGTTRGCMADSTGFYRLVGVTPGTIVLQCVAEGYLPVRNDTVAVTDSGWTVHNFVLQRNRSVSETIPMSH